MEIYQELQPWYQSRLQVQNKRQKQKIVSYKIALEHRENIQHYSEDKHKVKLDWDAISCTVD
jgi:hypothetical protein